MMPDYKPDPRHPNDKSCDNVARLIGLTAPRQWRGNAPIGSDFDPFSAAVAVRGNSIVNFWQFAPRGYQVRIEIINFALNSIVPIQVTIEFYDPQYQAVPTDAPNNAEVMRLLNPTALGGLDVHHYVNTNSGAGWGVPVTDNGRPWNLRILTNKADEIGNAASWHIEYNYTRIIGG